MHRYHRAAPIGVSEKMMTALDADHFKAQLAQGFDELRTGN